MKAKIKAVHRGFAVVECRQCGWTMRLALPPGLALERVPEAVDQAVCEECDPQVRRERERLERQRLAS